MHADRDDAPFPHRAPRRHGVLLALIALGGAATAVALHLPARLAALASPTPPATSAPLLPTFSAPAPAPAAAAPLAPLRAPPRSVAPPAPQIHAYRPAPVAATAPRQTEFNENNFQPREIVNRLPAVRSSPPERSQPIRRTKTVTRSAKWSWKTREGVVRGTFKWREQGGRIDYASVCMNEQRGSLRYRDCRKGAKVAFAKRCRKQRDAAACHAENNYSALR